MIGCRKHTSCNAKATVTIRHCLKHIWKDHTRVHPNGLCPVDLRWEHNHPLSPADVFHHSAVSPETNAKLLQLFTNGHSPSSALECIRMALEDNMTETETIEQLLAIQAIDTVTTYSQRNLRSNMVIHIAVINLKSFLTE